MSDPTLSEIIGEFNAGIFEKQVLAAICATAQGVVNTSKKGTVTIKLNFDQISDSQSVMVTHQVDYKSPTKNGSTGEISKTSTPMYVGKGGFLTISPELQEDLFKANKGTVTPINKNTN